MVILRIYIRTFRDKQFGDFLVTVISRKMQRSPSRNTLRIHIRTVRDKQFGDFLVTVTSRKKQRSHSTLQLSIHILTSIQMLFDGFDVSIFSSLVNIYTRPTPHQHHRCDCCE